MTFWKFSLVAVLASVGSLQAEPTPARLDELVVRPDFWSTPVAALSDLLARQGFGWTSATRDSARAAGEGLTFGGVPVNEAIVRFRDGRPAGVTVIFFNRGDAGELAEPGFAALIENATAAMSKLAGGPPVERGRDATSAVRAEGLVWSTPERTLTLEWSATKESKVKMIPFRAEFVRLEIAPPTVGRMAVGASTGTPRTRDVVKRFVGSEQVERLPGGGARLRHVPMVDQGQKGYCVVASVERVMRYFGAEVDQHELAQIANSDSAQGTSMEAMLASLKKLTQRLGVKSRPAYEWDLAEFLEIVDDYNRAAKRGKRAPEIALTGQVIDVDRILSQMQPEILREVRLKKTADLGKFQREIQRAIDAGLPLLWSVRLGLIKEKEIPQSAGGHMRLIVGYDLASKEILYSDSWGPGHEEKRMALADAWTITTGLTTLQPVGS
jgi:hypothetical protein